MKLNNLFTAGLSIAAVFTAAKYLTFSNQQNQVKELLPTKHCPQCNFSNANLKGLDLQGVNLQGANLEGANLSGAKLANATSKKQT
ncbi:pentapeptide repeat-containing protein [Microcoleus sp. AT9_B5]